MTSANKELFHISGSVIDCKTQRGVEGLRIEAWDKDLAFNDLVGNAVTNEQGMFQMEFESSYFQELFLDRKVDLFFKVFRNDALIESTEDRIHWNVDLKGVAITIEVDVAGAEKPQPWLNINSLDELLAHESQIVKRIANLPNGGNLFMAHPFMLLEDLGVQLSDQTQAEILSYMPELSVLSPIPYRALKVSAEPQSIHIHLKGLFPRRSQ